MATTRVPAAAPTPRVPRSRRDDRFQAGHPAPPKRANAGYVVSQQDDTDTVTVDILDEQLPGVVFLGDMPNVGDIVEVESRGDLLVITQQYPGPPPPTYADVFLTRARLVGNSPTRDQFLDLPADGPVLFELNAGTSPSTFLYPVQYDGHDAWTTDYYPATPDGYVLDTLTPFVVAHTEDAAQDPITVDTSTWGYSPPPTKSPFLLTDASSPLTFDTFPADTDPTDPIVCGASTDLADEQFQSALRIEAWYGSPPPSPPLPAIPCHIVMSVYGWRFTYTPAP